MPVLERQTSLTPLASQINGSRINERNVEARAQSGSHAETQPQQETSSSSSSINQVGYGSRKRKRTKASAAPSAPEESVDETLEELWARTGVPKRSRFAPVQEITEPESHEHYMILSEKTALNHEYKSSRCQLTAAFTDFELGVENPELILHEIIQRTLDSAIRTAETDGQHPERFLFMIESDKLDYPICVPIKQLNEDSVSSVVHRFELVDQSGRLKGRDSLYGAPFVVDVTAISHKQLRLSCQENGKHQRKGKGGRRNITVPHNINPRALINVNVNDDGRCLFRACEMLRARATMTRQQFRTYQKRERRQTKSVRKLMKDLKVPRDDDGYSMEQWGEKIEQHYNTKYAPKVFKLIAFDEVGYYKPYFKTERTVFDVLIPVYLKEGHFFAIKKLAQLFSAKCYCIGCYKAYDRHSTHDINCSIRCKLCSTVDASLPCQKVEDCQLKCGDCKKEFTNKLCYDTHIENNFCSKSTQCERCGVIYSTEVMRKKNITHHCEFKYCQRCHTYHDRNRGCNIKKLELPKERKPYRLIAFDFESTQDHQPVQGELRFEHRVNFISASVCCTECISEGKWDKPLGDDECEFCGRNRTYTWSQREFRKTAVDQKHVTETPLKDFVEWLLYEIADPSEDNCENLCISHFGGRYDMVLVFGEIFRLGGLRPEIVRQGNKLYEMTVEKKGQINKTVFRDTYNLMPVALGALPSTFALHDVEDKPFFPHLYNRECNLDRVLPNHPPKEDYLYKAMKPSKKDAFERWYETVKHLPFDLREELASYCTSDVKILLHASIKMRQLFMKVTGLDILLSKTIASACNKHFRTSHLPDSNTLALITEHGYGLDKEFKQSTIARKFLKWYEKVHNVSLQTSETPGKWEKKIGNYFVDGFLDRSAEGKRNLIVEVHGCYWHACPVHYPNDQQKCANGQTAGMVRKRNVERENFLRQHADLEVVWECEIKEQRKADPEMNKFFTECWDSGALRLRDAFFGGRTNVHKMLAQSDEHHTIKYVDVQSLYPYINFTGNYPISQPKCRMFNQKVRWRNESDMDKWRNGKEAPYLEGIIKCLVVPPRGNSATIPNGADPLSYYPPVLPQREDDRLLFSFCSSCSKMFKEGFKDANYRCPHFAWEERAFVATTTSAELRLALQNGYEVRQLFRSYYFDRWSNTLFKGYVKEFLGIKVKSSDWPADCVMKPDATEAEVKEIEAKRESFINKNKDDYEIEIDGDEMEYNPGLRYIAKLCLNSLWGRFALRNNLSKSLIIDTPVKFCELLDNDEIEVTGIEQLNKTAFLATYRSVEEFVIENPSSNIVISLYTTSLARIHLYKFLKMVVDGGGEIIYMDTDSIIYRFKNAKGDPVETGSVLGTMNDEYPNHTIVEVVVAGNKNYGLKLHRNGDPEDKFEYVLKAKGFTLDFETCQRVTYEEMKKRILNYGTPDEPEALSISYNMVRPDKRGQIHTINVKKHYKALITKGVVIDDYKVVPFGWFHYRAIPSLPEYYYRNNMEVD